MNHNIMNKFFEGHSLDAHQIFGAHFGYDGGSGVRFTLYAPNALQVHLVGDFNEWTSLPMHQIDKRGVWSVFVFDVKEYHKYKYKIETKAHEWIEKTDPFAFFSEQRPGICSKVYQMNRFLWNDDAWLSKRTNNVDGQLNIYELHLGSWRRKGNNDWYSYEEITNELVNYIKTMGYTHIELLPLSEHPFDGSWGYQSTGYFSATSRYGNPKQLMHLINECHRNDIGVIFDFVPIHFVKDDHGLAMFDGGALYEYEEEEKRYSQWDTINFDLQRETVRSFLLSSISFWISYYHLDGIRMDAISNLVFWDGNKDKGINHGACDFIKRLNFNIHERYPTVMMIAEDSSDFVGVTKSTLQGGLGFDYKWDLGWMNDTLSYYAKDPVHRKFHHHTLTFSMAYFYSEQFLLPLSHDEVVHGKGTIVNKMWGDYDTKFAQARNLYTYMYTHPGKKLNFMGNELAQFSEWDEKKQLDWQLLEYSRHAAFNRFIRDLNMVYKHYNALSRFDYQSNRGFQWIDANNAEQSIYSYIREDEKDLFVVILNMTSTSYEHFLIGVPKGGVYQEIINSQKDIYEGCNMCNYVPIASNVIPMHGFDSSIDIRIAPFGAIVFQLQNNLSNQEHE